jgi:L-lactate dehydrogenase
MPITSFKGFSTAEAADLEKKTRGAGAEVIRQKGGAGYAVGIAIAEVVHSFLLDQRRILPISTIQQGTYGVRDVSYSVPTVLGRSGVMQHLEIDLWQKEKEGLIRSAEVLEQAWQNLPSGS